MLAWFKRKFGLFWAEKETGPAIGTVETRVLRRWREPEVYAQEEGLEEAAYECARLNQPAADAIRPPAALVKLTNYMHDGATRLAEIANQTAEAARTVVNGLTVPPLNCMNAVYRLGTRLMNHSLEQRATVIERTQAAGASSRALAEFRLKGNIRRPARQTPPLWDTITLLTVFVMVESALNVGFMQPMFDTGMLMAFGYAIGISALNVGVFGYFLVGRILAPMVFYHPWHLLRWVAGAGVILISTVVAILNMLLAHARDAAVRGEDESQFDVAAILFNLFKWAELHNIGSTVLFVLGVTAFGAAVFKGYQDIEPIPDYAELSRADADARTARDEARDKYTKLVIGIIEEVRTSLHNIHDFNETNLQEARRALTSAQLKLKSIANAMHTFAEGCGGLWHRFFDINRAIRPMAVLPAWANHPPNLDAKRSALANVDDLDASIASASQQHEKNAAELASFDRVILDQRQKILESFYADLEEATNAGQSLAYTPRATPASTSTPHLIPVVRP